MESPHNSDKKSLSPLPGLVIHLQVPQHLRASVCAKTAPTLSRRAGLLYSAPAGAGSFKFQSWLHVADTALGQLFAPTSHAFLFSIASSFISSSTRRILNTR